MLFKIKYSDLFVKGLVDDYYSSLTLYYAKYIFNISWKNLYIKLHLNFNVHIDVNLIYFCKNRNKKWFKKTWSFAF